MCESSVEGEFQSVSEPKRNDNRNEMSLEELTKKVTETKWAFISFGIWDRNEIAERERERRGDACRQ